MKHVANVKFPLNSVPIISHFDVATQLLKLKFTWDFELIIGIQLQIESVIKRNMRDMTELDQT